MVAFGSLLFDSSENTRDYRAHPERSDDYPRRVVAPESIEHPHLRRKPTTGHRSYPCTNARRVHVDFPQVWVDFLLYKFQVSFACPQILFRKDQLILQINP
ncbi:hypothetical protein LENED_001318 [Lentinula edodes]|uniref:Uncharacterized protein n=1 Tax=Lentinula edodes TaxID=5353 RepID=A0A1Q3DXV9_LENED|nr:hypothetical protein LENED_001318 [Lentinula edodes]